MSRILRNTSGGKAISGGALAPRSRRNNTLQVDSYFRGGAAGLPLLQHQDQGCGRLGPRAGHGTVWHQQKPLVRADFGGAESGHATD